MILLIARSLNEVREKSNFDSRPLAVVEDQGAHIQAAETLAEPVGSFFRRRKKSQHTRGLFMVAPP